MGDVLFPVRNLFYLGSFQGAINEAQDIEGLSDVDSTERDVFVYRAYIALGSAQLVISEIADSAPLALTAVKLFAEYVSKARSKDDCVAALQAWMEDPAANTNATACLVAGLIYAREGNHVEALKACHGASASLEMQALSVQVLLAMDRPDQAERGVKAMSGADDDATLTQLATAWTGLALGGAKVQEAAYIYQELGDKYTWTAQLHAGLAAANMRMGRWEEAETELQDALKKDDKDAEALANLVACLLHRGKAYDRHLKQLRMQAPQHPFLARWDAAGEALDRAAMAAG